MMGKALQPSGVGTAFCAHAGSINHIPISLIASHRPYRRIGHAHIDETSNIRYRMGTKGRAHPTWLRALIHSSEGATLFRPTRAVYLDCCAMITLACERILRIDVKLCTTSPHPLVEF
jgi:hypothetical protein